MISDELNIFVISTCEHWLDIVSLESKVLIILFIDGLKGFMGLSLYYLLNSP